MINSQVHESTKHAPYELVFGQPPILLDNSFRENIDEEDLRYLTCAKVEDSRGDSVCEGSGDGVVMEKDNEENYCEKDKKMMVAQETMALRRRTKKIVVSWKTMAAERRRTLKMEVAR